MCVLGINGGHKCKSRINDVRICVMGVNGDRTCLESTLATLVNDGCTCIGDQQCTCMYVGDQR